MRIIVASGDWGNARLCDIEKVLANTASQLNRLMRLPFSGSILVVPVPSSETPIALYRNSPEQPFVVGLTTHDRHWCQFAFQFSHEFCHILSNYESLKDNPNQWFHETICEVASVFCLRRMAEEWVTHPPYANWATYSTALASYAQERLSRQESKLPSGASLSEWLSAQEVSLRKNAMQRDLNSVVAYALLPAFEDNPAGWNAIREFPHSTGQLTDYTADWQGRVDSADKPFVARLAKILLAREADRIFDSQRTS
jgi:hypothetical protein